MQLLNLNDFLQKNIKQHSLCEIIEDIAQGSLLVNNYLLNGDPEILGAEGIKNIQEEDVQKLDVIANNIFLELFGKNNNVSGILSEENENIIVGDSNGDFLIAMDPLDGSSNINVNIPVGSIFSIYEKTNKTKAVSENDFLQQGEAQKMAAYVLYGTSTILVIAINSEVHGFTLNLEQKTYFLTYPNIQTPKTGNIFSINEGNLETIDQEICNYVKYCKTLNNEGKRTHTGRFIGSLVADFHRNMIKGGVFIYPKTADKPNGQLRLIYECNPMALIASFSGGKSSDSEICILQKTPNNIHERTAFIVGSEDMVNKLLSFYKK